jgi:ABC-type glutathione transport system ATPase component
VSAGEVVVVIGPSGSGKSTLCRCINRLETIDIRRITIDGQPLPEEGRELARLRADRRRFGCTAPYGARRPKASPAMGRGRTATVRLVFETTFAPLRTSLI